MAREARVRLLNRQRKLKVDAARLTALIARVLVGEEAPPRASVTVVLFRDPRVAALNARYRGIDAATDVLSFPVEDEAWPDEEPPLLGEVVISVDRAIEQAHSRRLPVRRELERLIVHGVLHLLGHDDRTAAERTRMRRREDRYLQAMD